MTLLPCPYPHPSLPFNPSACCHFPIPSESGNPVPKSKPNAALQILPQPAETANFALKSRPFRLHAPPRPAHKPYSNKRK